MTAPTTSEDTASRGVARLGHGWRDHWPFLVLLAAGAALRLIVMLAYRPALEFVQDSFGYLGAAKSLSPDVVRPVGYSFFLRVLSLTGNVSSVPVAQHILGLVSAS